MLCSALVLNVFFHIEGITNSRRIPFIRHSLTTFQFSRLADLKILEASPELESSPELSDSFEFYLKERKKKAEEVKMNLAQSHMESPRSSKAEPVRRNVGNLTMYSPDEEANNTMTQCTDDSFLAMEKLCDNTVNLGNVSENLLDLTALEKQKTPFIGDETHLNDIEAPSFFFNNTSMMSANKNSPLLAVHANRPSTILEVSEVSLTNKTNMSSYRTAFTGSGTETSEEYRTACEDTFSRSRPIEEEIIIKMPKIRSFYGDMTKDSLETTEKKQFSDEMTKDSLNPESYADESSSGVESSFDQQNESHQNESVGEVKMNDTLERIEYMLAQAEIMREEKSLRSQPATPASTSKPKVFPKTTTASKALRDSPLIKFSPVVKSPMNSDSAFKKPIQSFTKIPQPSFSNNKKFMHIASPIARYIKETPGLPLTSTARVYPGIGNNSPRQFNFRDSDAFSNENESLNAYKGSSLPFKAKTKSSATPHVRLLNYSCSFPV